MSTVPKLSIEIIVYLDDEIWAKKEAENWEVAEQNLGSLEREFEKQQALAEIQAEENNN